MVPDARRGKTIFVGVRYCTTEKIVETRNKADGIILSALMAW